MNQFGVKIQPEGTKNGPVLVFKHLVQIMKTQSNRADGAWVWIYVLVTLRCVCACVCVGKTTANSQQPKKSSLFSWFRGFG